MTDVFHGEDIVFDLYPKTDPKNGPRIRRLTSLQKGSKVRREQKGTGLIRITIPGDSVDAEAIDPTLGHYVKAERKGAVIDLALSAAADDTLDTTVAHGLLVGNKLEFVTLTGGAGLSTTPTYYVESVPSATSLKVAATKGGPAIDFTTDITAGSIRKLTTVAGGFLLGGTYAALSKDGTKPLVLTGPGPLHILSRAAMAPHSYIGDDPQPEGVWPLHKQGPFFGDDHYGSMFARAMHEMKSTQADDPGDDPDSPHPNANDRLVDPIPEVTLTFDGFTDSNGVAWTGARGEFDVQVALEDGLRIAFRFMQAGLEIDIDPDTFELRAYNTGTLGSDRTGAAWGAGVVRYQVPTDDTVATSNILTTAIRSLSAFIQRSLLWAGRENVWGVARNASAPVRWEGGYSSDAADETSLNTIAGQQIAERTDAGDVPRLKVLTDATPDESRGVYRYGPGGHADIWDRATVHSGTGTWDWNDWTAPISAVEWVIENPNGEWDTYVEFGSTFRSINEVMQFAGGAVISSGPRLRLCIPGVLATEEILYTLDWETESSPGSGQWQSPLPAFPSIGQPAATMDDAFGATGDGGGHAWSTNVTPRSLIPGSLSPYVTFPCTAGVPIRLTFAAQNRVGDLASDVNVEWVSGDFATGWTSISSEVAAVAPASFASFDVTLTPPVGATAARVYGAVLTIDNFSVWTTGAAASPNDGHPDLVGTGGRATRCDHRHDVHRDTAPTVNDDETLGYKVGTRWAQLDSLSAPTAIVGVWILADASEGAAVWLQEPLHSTHAAEDVDFTPAGTVAATDVQAAVEEVATDAAAALTTHEGAADPHTGYVREADPNWTDLTDGGETALHTHAGGGGASALDDLTDVTITTPADGHGVRYDGTGWVNEAEYATIVAVIDGGGGVIAAGVVGDVGPINFPGVIEAVTLLADQSGSIVVDIWKDTYANFPPTDADSITAAAVPTIGAATKAQDTTLTGWTTTLAAGDILRFNVDSATSIERVTVALKVRKT